MTDDTDHPLDANLGGDDLPKAPASADVITLPVVLIERAPANARTKPGHAKRKSKAASGKKRSGRIGAPKGNQYALGNKGGQGGPPKYRAEFVELARQACEAGLTDRELAEIFDVSEVTIGTWKIKHPEFALSLKMGKDIADDRAERTLYQRALGYEYKAEKVFANGFRADVREHVTPDTTALIFWLKNRRPAQWRDVQKVDHTHRVRTSAEILEEIKRDVVELGLLPDGSFGDAGAE